jgi:L-arabinose isomerase
MVQVKTPIKDYLEKVFESGVTHHCIVGSTDMSRELMAVAELLNLKTFYIE